MRTTLSPTPLFRDLLTNLQTIFKHSVAGRGVFSTKDLIAGEEIITIPPHAALTQGNGALNFPSLADELLDLRKQKNPKQPIKKEK